MIIERKLIRIKLLLILIPVLCSLQLIAQEEYPYIPVSPGLSGRRIHPAYEGMHDSIVVKNNTISFHPLLIVDGTVALGYERTFSSRKHSARIIGGFSSLRQASYYDINVKEFSQVYGEFDFKFFLSRRKKEAPRGLYAAPYIQYRSAEYSYETPGYLTGKSQLYKGYSANSAAGGVMLGYLDIILEMLTLEMYMGVGQQVVNGDYEIMIHETKYYPLSSGFFWNQGPLFKFGVSLGVNF